MNIEPLTGRAVINAKENGLEIYIPAKREIGSIIVICIWLSISSLMVVGGISMMLDSSTFVWSIMAFGIVQIVIGGALMAAPLYVLIWMLSGKEIIIVEGNIFRCEHVVLGIRRIWNYSIPEMKNLQLHIPPQKKKKKDKAIAIEAPWQMKFGKIKFDYGVKTLHFGSEIDKQEAEYLIEVLRESHFFLDESFVT